MDFDNISNLIEAKMTDANTNYNDAFIKVKKWASHDKECPSLVISEETELIYLAYSTGMGNSDCTPINKLPSLYLKIIEGLYESGELKVSGKEFSLYPGSGFFRKLQYKPSNI
ncbi:hypothetical protein PSPO_b0874 [Pseudoalteromonas spongiae UST010723-006]|nr:hypothetical protein PSPO_b0874 [Pseudoalteromonas spongiae UST010723-006]